MKNLIVLALFLGSVSVAYTQGCSDAGFCTMGAMKPDQPYNKKQLVKLRSMELSFYRGTTTLTPIVYVATADLNFSVGRKSSFQVKLPYQAVRGELANTSGLGDISLCFTRNVYTSDKFEVNLSVGGKIASNNSNKHDEEGNALPMYYQTSLGTYDFITGISLKSRQWLFATGIQHPFNKNGNQFLWSRWIGDQEEQDHVKLYQQANRLKRGTDVMFRVERNFRFSRFNYSLGLLPIYRITNDRIEDINGNTVKPVGAKGLAMSGIATIGYNFNVKSGVRLLVGHKLVQRDKNPDGLTRELVSSLTYSYRF
jgi:hypothetical protein